MIIHSFKCKKRINLQICQLTNDVITNNNFYIHMYKAFIRINSDGLPGWSSG